jgi:hypothetical protein
MSQRTINVIQDSSVWQRIISVIKDCKCDRRLHVGMKHEATNGPTCMRPWHVGSCAPYPVGVFYFGRMS